MKRLRSFADDHRLQLALMSLACTAVFAAFILVVGRVAWAFSIAYLVVIGTLTLLLRLR